MKEGLRGRAIGVTKDVFLAVTVQNALVHVHGAAGLARNGFGHESGIHVLAQRRLAHGALKKEHLVGQAQGVIVEEVNLHLARANLMNQGVYVQVHEVAVLINLFKQRVEFVDGVDAIGLARRFGAAAAANGWAQRHIAVGIACCEVKLQLGRNHRLPALGGIQVTDTAQHAAWCIRHQLAFGVKTIVNHLRGGVGGPRHNAHGGGVGAQLHVAVGGVDHIKVGAAGWLLARHAHGHNGVG